MLLDKQLSNMKDKKLIFYFLFREWYSYHFPELVKIVPDNYMYARVAQLIKNRKELNQDKLDDLEEIVN